MSAEWTFTRQKAYDAQKRQHPERAGAIKKLFEGVGWALTLPVLQDPSLSDLASQRLHERLTVALATARELVSAEGSAPATDD
jgi:hypothetical protein